MTVVIETYTVRYPAELHISQFKMPDRGAMPILAKHWILDSWGEILKYKQVDYLDKSNDIIIRAYGYTR